jgi:hypothetical protein
MASRSFEFPLPASNRRRWVSLRMVGDTCVVSLVDEAPCGPTVQLTVPADQLFRFVDQERAKAQKRAAALHE